MGVNLWETNKYETKADYKIMSAIWYQLQGDRNLKFSSV